MSRVRIRITLKPGILDPQGQTVLGALRHLGFAEAEDCRIGRLVELRFPQVEHAELEREVAQICQRLLVNPNTETWEAEYLPGVGDGGR